MKVSDQSVSNEQIQFRFEDNTIFLIGVLDFVNVKKLFSDIDKKTNNITKLKIDLTDITYCNSAGVALLLAVLRSAKAKKQEIMLTNIPNNLTDIINMCGLEHILGEIKN